ncbi:MAG: hypothetical protein WEB78_09800 [Ilumatobacteraceae bacterium]
MSPIGRRQFCALVGVGLAGLSAGCSRSSAPAGSATDPTDPTDPTSGGGGGVLAGVSLEAHRDPG